MGKLVMAALAAWVLATAPTNAAPLTRTFDFSATGFPADAPTGVVAGTFTVTFDPTGGDVNGETAGIHLGSLNIALDSALGFDYFAPLDRLIVGGISDNPNGIFAFTNDFTLYILNASTDPIFALFDYVTTESCCGYRASEGLVQVAGVPEPASIGLLLMGLMAVARWRKAA